MTEEWRAVPGFEGRYEVSDLGRVRSFARYPEGVILRPGRMKSGHTSVVLGREAGSYCVHALVMVAFVGPCPSSLEVRHLNGVAGDNRLANLEYASRARNSQDKKWHAHRPSGYRLRPAQVAAIKAALGPHGAGARLARQYDVAQSTISAIKHGVFHADVS